MPRLGQSKQTLGYEVRAWCRLRHEAKIIYFHVFNVSLNHLGGKTSACLVLALARHHVLWAPLGYYDILGLDIETSMDRLCIILWRFWLHILRLRYPQYSASRQVQLCIEKARSNNAVAWLYQRESDTVIAVSNIIQSLVLFWMCVVYKINISSKCCNSWDWFWSQHSKKVTVLVLVYNTLFSPVFLGFVW